VSTLANGGDLPHFNLNFVKICIVDRPDQHWMGLADDDSAPFEYKATGANLSLNKLVATGNKYPDLLNQVSQAPQALENIGFFCPRPVLGGHPEAAY
jgi:hypothetical protein